MYNIIINTKFNNSALYLINFTLKQTALASDTTVKQYLLCKRTIVYNFARNTIRLMRPRYFIQNYRSRILIKDI